MKGAAPNSSVTGFQALDERNFQPSAARAGAELTNNWLTRRTVIARMLHAKIMTTRRATVSPTREELFLKRTGTAVAWLAMTEPAYCVTIASCFFSIATTDAGSGA